jgi:hypothetical protein
MAVLIALFLILLVVALVVMLKDAEQVYEPVNEPEE